jgi:hypothetical protein
MLTNLSKYSRALHKCHWGAWQNKIEDAPVFPTRERPKSGEGRYVEVLPGGGSGPCRSMRTPRMRAPRPMFEPDVLYMLSGTN